MAVQHRAHGFLGRGEVKVNVEGRRTGLLLSWTKRV
jgi:hypothetical protein